MVLDKQGHRGCRSLMPENTIPAMIKAVELSVQTLEMDVVITKDKQVLLSHEPFFNHEISTKPDGKYVTPEEERTLNIYQMNYSETSLYDVGLKPHPRFPAQKKLKALKPLLKDVIDSVETYCTINNLPKVKYNIETKTQPSTDNLYHPPPVEFVDLLMGVIEEKGITSRSIIQSFDPRTLQYVHKKFAIKTALLINEEDKRSIEIQFTELGFFPAIYSPHYSLVTEEIIRGCHARNMLIIPWTINDRDKINFLEKIGVDGIITDDPTLFKKN